VTVQLADVHVSFSGDVVLDSVSWRIDPGQRWGLVGPNGAGKTTLLRLLAGELPPEGGQVARPRALKVGYLRQKPDVPPGATLRDVVLRPLAALTAVHARLAEVRARIDHAAAAADGPAAEEAAAEFAALEERFAHGGGYSLEARAAELLADFGLGGADWARAADTLSGGEKGRLMLAEVILSEPDLLLLDEPTNHLDLAGVEKLEDVLRVFPGAVVVVSHDRYFLDRVTTRTIEVGRGALDAYAGNYSFFAAERPRRHAQRYQAYAGQQAEIARIEDFIRRNIAGQKTNQAKGRRKALARLERIPPPEDPWSDASRFGIGFDAGERSSKLVAEARGVARRHGARTLFAGLDLAVYRGERLGIVGPNGAGKSTLLRLLLGREPPDDGTIEVGQNLAVGYYEQEQHAPDGPGSVLEEMLSCVGHDSPYQPTEAMRTYLGRFRFYGDDVLRPVRALSGGEAARLSFAKLMIEPRSVLVLDEPTNHLDIPAREALERTLADYEGTLLVVSHDRFFLDRVVRTLLVLGDGPPVLHHGTYTEWKTRRAAIPPPRPAPARAAAPANDRAGERASERAAVRARRKAAERFAEVEKDIAALEARLKAVTADLCKDHGGDWERLGALAKEEEALRRRLERALSEWERLGADLEQPEQP
jgi:ATP-binding cassette subfamily F protein 3